MAYMGKIGAEVLAEILKRHPTADRSAVEEFDVAFVKRAEDGKPITVHEFVDNVGRGFFELGWTKETLAAVAEAGEAAFGVERILCHGCPERNFCDISPIDELPDKFQQDDIPF